MTARASTGRSPAFSGAFATALAAGATRAPGGGAFGTGIGALASLLAFFGDDAEPRFPTSWARIARLLFSPRTGVRSTKIQPT
ncbi:MAG: hypothetical protein EBU67_00345 [Actinobacteria bacterium]|nr:hypothetical protein [Actinomycetota bacterium]